MLHEPPVGVLLLWVCLSWAPCMSLLLICSGCCVLDIGLRQTVAWANIVCFRPGPTVLQYGLCCHGRCWGGV
jgi:hypothetical protein